MPLLVLYVVVAFALAFAARKRHPRFLGWFLIALVLTPIGAVIVFVTTQTRLIPLGDSYHFSHETDSAPVTLAGDVHPSKKLHCSRCTRLIRDSKAKRLQLAPIVYCSHCASIT